MPKNKPIFKVWVKIDIERIVYEENKYENICEALPIDIGIFDRKKDAKLFFDDLVELLEKASEI